MENKLKIYANKADVTRNTNDIATLKGTVEPLASQVTQNTSDIIGLKGQVFKYGYVLSNEANEPYTMMVIGSELATFPGIAIPSRETNLTSDSLRALINESGLDPHDVTSIVFPNGTSIEAGTFDDFRNIQEGVRSKDDGIYEFNYIHAPQVTSIADNEFTGVGGSAKYLTINLSNTTEEEAKSIPGLMNYTTGWRNDGGKTNIIWKSENKVWPIVVNVTPENRAGATIEVENNPVVWKGSTKITATVDEGYSLDCVIINGVEYPLVDGETVYTLPDDEDSARALMESGVTVQYTPIPVGARAFTIESDDNGGKFGSMTVGGIEKNGKEVKFVREGETLALDYTFTPKPGYSIKGIYETYTSSEIKKGVSIPSIEYSSPITTGHYQKVISYEDLADKPDFNVICEYTYDALNPLFTIDEINSLQRINTNNIKVIPGSWKVGSGKGMDICKYPKYTIENGKAVGYEVKEGLWYGSTSASEKLTDTDLITDESDPTVIKSFIKRMAKDGHIFDREAFENGDFENACVFRFGPSFRYNLNTITSGSYTGSYYAMQYDEMNDIFLMGTNAYVMFFFRGATWFDTYAEFEESLKYGYPYQNLALPVPANASDSLIMSVNGNNYLKEWFFYSIKLGEITGNAPNRSRKIYFLGLDWCLEATIPEISKDALVLPAKFEIKKNTDGAWPSDDTKILRNTNVLFQNPTNLRANPYGTMQGATWDIELPNNLRLISIDHQNDDVATRHMLVDITTGEHKIVCKDLNNKDMADATMTLGKGDNHNPIVIIGVRGDSDFGVYQFSNDYTKMFYLGEIKTCFSSARFPVNAGVVCDGYSALYMTNDDKVYMLVPSDYKSFQPGDYSSSYLSNNNFFSYDKVAYENPTDYPSMAVVKLFDANA